MRICAVYVALAQALEAALVTLDYQQRQCVPDVITAYAPAELLRTIT